MTCPYCQHPIGTDSRFCDQCGKPIVIENVSVQQAILSGEFDTGALARLRREKRHLAQRLNTLLEGALGRVLTEDERRSWETLYTEWKQITDELTARMNYLEVRQESDRRRAERRQQERRKEYHALDFEDRRAGRDRREGERRRGVDRRDPFGDPDSGPGPIHTPVPNGS